MWCLNRAKGECLCSLHFYPSFGGALCTLTYGFHLKILNNITLLNPTDRHLGCFHFCCHKCCSEYPEHVALSTHIRVSQVPIPSSGALGLEGMCISTLLDTVKFIFKVVVQLNSHLHQKKRISVSPTASPNLDTLTFPLNLMSMK